MKRAALNSVSNGPGDLVTWSPKKHFVPKTNEKGVKPSKHRQIGAESNIREFINTYNMVELAAAPKMVKDKIVQPDMEKLKELTHYIVSRCGSAPHFGRTLLWKILYFSDFDYYELHYKSITGESYRKIEHGPAPCHIEKVLDSLTQEKKISQVKGAKFFNHDLKKFIAKEEPVLTCLCADEIKVVDKVIQRLSSMTAKQVSEYSHLDTPWRVTDDKKIIDYEYVFHRSPITSVRSD